MCSFICPTNQENGYVPFIYGQRESVLTKNKNKMIFIVKCIAEAQLLNNMFRNTCMSLPHPFMTKLGMKVFKL